jgi:hypothetical protein
MRSTSESLGIHTAGQKYVNSGWPLGPKFRRKIGSRHTSVVKISVRQYQQLANYQVRFLSDCPVQDGAREYSNTKIFS